MKERIILTVFIVLALFSVIFLYSAIPEDISDSGKVVFNEKNSPYAGTGDAGADNAGDAGQDAGAASGDGIAQGVTGFGVGGTNGAGGVGGNTEAAAENKTEFPEDLYTANCGVYFQRYGVCAGTCPSGKCIQEGRSCYCRER